MSRYKLGRIFKKDIVPRSVEDLAFLECNDIDKIRRKLSKNFHVEFKFRWRYHPQEDIFVIHYAAARGSNKAISCLVEHGADVNTQTNSQGLTPLHFAVLFSNIDVMEELVNRGGDINSREYGRGYTPLHYACERKNLGAVKCLMELLANTDIRDIYGRTPIQIAQAMNCDQICKTLRDFQEADNLKSNVNFLAGEQIRQKDQLEQFKHEVQNKFQEIDYWKSFMENRVEQTERYNRLRQSMREAKQTSPMFYQDPCPSRSSSISDLSVTTEVQRPIIVKRNVLSANPKASKSVKNLVSKFEKLQSNVDESNLRGAASVSCVSINSVSTLSGYDSGLSSRPESRLSTSTEKGCDNNFAYEEASLIQSNYHKLVQQMCPTDVTHKLFAENKISLSFKDRLRGMSDVSKNEEILDHVLQSDWETFGIFMTALDETGQSHLSDMVRYSKAPYIYV